METARSYNSTSELSFTDNLTTTANFAAGKYSGALLAVTDSGGAARILTFYCKPSSDSNESYVLTSNNTTSITLTVTANRCYEVPKELFAANTISATTPTGTTVKCKVYLKG